MTNSSTFSLDFWKEKQLSKYLDIVYKKLGFEFERVEDKQLQKEGIDLFLSFESFQDIIVDEKAQLSYIDRDLSTFAFEIGYLYNDYHKNGWLFDQNKKTQYYLLICNIKTQKGNRKLSDNKIISFEIILISRKKLIIFLHEKGISYEEVKLKEKEYREKSFNGRIPIKGEENMYFFLTQKLAEKPFNIVIKKKELKKISDFYKIINLNHQRLFLVHNNP